MGAAKIEGARSIEAQALGQWQGAARQLICMKRALAKMKKNERRYWRLYQEARKTLQALESQATQQEGGDD